MVGMVSDMDGLGLKMYEFVKEMCDSYDAIYEDYLIRLIGERGIQTLKDGGLLECCGEIDGRKIYSLK